MARSDEGLSSSTKVLLAVLGGGGLLALVCCGGVAWLANRAWQNFQQTIEESIAEIDEMDDVYVFEPQDIADLTASIVEIRIPSRYEPNSGEDYTSTQVARKQVSYGSADFLGSVVIREMLREDVTTRDDAARILADEMKVQGSVYEFDSESNSRRSFTIEGEECVFEFQSGNDPETGDAVRQVMGAVPSGGGVAYLVMYDTAANWDEAEIVAMIESIRIGQPRQDVELTPAASSPDAATPTESPPESPVETPAVSPGEMPETPDASATTPQQIPE